MEPTTFEYTPATIASISLEEVNQAGMATYRETLELVKKSGEIFRMPVDNIVIIADWNDRINFDDIPELAEGIYTNKSTDEIEGYMLKNGKFAVIDGERRTRAYKYMGEKYPDEEWVKFMNVKILPKGLTKKEMMIRKNAANNQKNWEPLEEARSWRKMFDEGMTRGEIARALGKNKMHVGDRINLSYISAIELEFVESKIISLTEWVRLFKLEPNIAKRYDILARAEKDGEIIKDAKSLFKEPEVEAAPEPAPPIEPPAITEVENIPDGLLDEEDDEPAAPQWDRDATRQMMDELDAEREETTKKRQEEAFTGMPGIPKTGLAALLERSTVPPSEEPEPKIKPTRFAGPEAISDEVGSTLGDQTPETGTVEETLKAVLIELRALERFANGDSRMTDITFRMDKKLRYIQKIAASTMMSKMTGESIKAEVAEAKF